MEQCNGCGHERITYNSCRNRHCPKCQSLARARWVEKQVANLLPVPYFHVVFTVPACVAEIALQNQRTVYEILFRATARTLLTIAADPKHLGAEIGFMAVLHSWGQNLHFHPHLHCVIPGGGLAPNGRWIASGRPRLPKQLRKTTNRRPPRKRKRWLLPVRVLSALFRRLFLEMLNAAHERGELAFHGQLAPLQDPRNFHEHLEPARQKKWVVYAKRPFGGPEQVVEYLGQYTHRTAISNRRLLTLEDGKVTFRMRDYRHGNAVRNLTLDAHEFMRRFLMHVLPERFVRIRYFGFLSSRHRPTKLASCRKQLRTRAPELTTCDWKAQYERLTGRSVDSCPVCKEGKMETREVLPSVPEILRQLWIYNVGCRLWCRLMAWIQQQRESKKRRLDSS